MDTCLTLNYYLPTLCGSAACCALSCLRRYIRGTLFLRKLYLKNFNIQNKNNKISQGSGNSLRNEVRGWVELCSPDPLKPLPTGWENKTAPIYCSFWIVTPLITYLINIPINIKLIFSNSCCWWGLCVCCRLWLGPAPRQPGEHSQSRPSAAPTPPMEHKWGIVLYSFVFCL